ncbi:P-loop NTPase fold protein [Candidatus Uabimicrobium sp. HlEnr_7]|uniref:ATP-binding protein n=1 Tax=Candidatus Uabimicrobium helgolandensis TaxID=3095367 RepID=UPI0035588046
MTDKKEVFIDAYNNFEIRPLSGQGLKDFYVESFTKDSIENIKTTIHITKSPTKSKILVIGHRGCGKSTILNKVAEELEDKYHVVSFSASDVLNMMDVESLDILLTCYIQVLKSTGSLLNDSIQDFKEVIEFLEDRIEIEGNPNLLEDVLFKLQVEVETRNEVRRQLKTEIGRIQHNLSKLCKEIQKSFNKRVLIIIDDLDKLATNIAKKVFFTEANILIMIEAQVLFTYPLHCYYHPSFIQLRDQFNDQFISPVNLYDFKKEPQSQSFDDLKTLILKRIDKNLIDEEALKHLIYSSGGLLRDLVKFMQDACLKAFRKDVQKIDKEITVGIINKHVNDYSRIFDFDQYQSKIETIHKTRAKDIDHDSLIYLLHYLFILEYRSQEILWYGVHPCLEKALQIDGENYD